jgi:hypothetical protein
VVRPCIWEEGFVGWKGITEMGDMVEVVGGGPWNAYRRAGVSVAHRDGVERKGVGNSSCISNVGRLFIHASVCERHLPKDKRERIKGWVERALLRVEVMGIGRRDRWRVGGTSFWCHRGKRKNKHDDK